MFAVFAVKIVVKHKSVGTRSLALRASAIVAHTVRLQKQRVPKGGDERAGFLHALTVFCWTPLYGGCTPTGFQATAAFTDQERDYGNPRVISGQENATTVWYFPAIS